MANRVRDREKEVFWRDVVRRFNQAGLTVREFCRREGLAEANFYAWRRTIAERDARAARSKKTNGDEAKKSASRPRKRKSSVAKTSRPKREQAGQSFVPVVIDAELISRDEIVLDLLGGRRLRLDAATSPEQLAAIVHAIESEVGR